MSIYLRDLDRLDEVIDAGLAHGHDEVANAVRAMIETVTIMPTPPGRAPGIILKGDIQSAA